MDEITRQYAKKPNLKKSNSSLQTLTPSNLRNMILLSAVSWGFSSKEAAGIEKGSGIPNKEKVAKLSRAKIEEIAKRKMPDLNANDLESAMKIVEGTARSMGIEIENNN